MKYRCILNGDDKLTVEARQIDGPAARLDIEIAGQGSQFVMLDEAQIKKLRKELKRILRAERS